MSLLPSRLKIPLGRLLLGWEVDKTAYVGRSIINVRKLTMGPGASIGPLNVIRMLDELRLEEGASIGSRNWITGYPKEINFAGAANRDPSFIMGKYAMLTEAHDIDCIDRVTFGDYAGLAGFRCTILTHSLNLLTDKFVTGPVAVGHHSAVMSGCTLMSGVSIPPRCIISGGSVVNTKLTEELTFYRGNPAEAVRTLPATLKFFHRGEPGFPHSPTIALTQIEVTE